jgi:DNA polymerase-3 subunit delta'
MESVTYPWIPRILERLPQLAGALPRALLLAGQAGMGKRSTALFLVQAILCETGRNELAACGACVSCRLFQAGNHPDLRMLEVASEEVTRAAASTDEEEAGTQKKATRQISVEAVRALNDFITITSHRAGAKAVFIAPAEAMHPSAANALLKMLEEPPADTFFLLVSHQPERLLATIRSRCVRLAFTLPEQTDVRNWLKGQGLENQQLALAQGSYAPLAALERARDATFWEQRKILLDALASSVFDPVHAADLAENIVGARIATLLAQWSYDAVALISGGNVRYHFDYAASLQEIAQTVDFAALIDWYDSVIEFGRVAQHPLNKRLAMESLFSGYPFWFGLERLPGRSAFSKVL